MKISELYGRRVLFPQSDNFSISNPQIQVLPTMKITETSVTCLRCGSVMSKRFVALPNHHYYCPQCVTLGRVSTLDKFYHVQEPNQFETPERVLTWEGKLSELQAATSAVIKERMNQHCRQLLWAVTGAGKTEMIFAGIEAALKRGERVAIASPRVDVCLELYPRLQAAFANFPIALLHGREPQRYQYRQLTICTTHQLLRFYRAFDNLIVDEVDSFPYAANQALLYATEQAIKEEGGLLFMTATPGKKLIQQIHNKKLMVSYLPLRYHGNLLPQIKLYLAFNWRKGLVKKHLPTSLLREIRNTLNNHYRCLLFVPHIADLHPVFLSLQHTLPDKKFTTVHAADPHRLEKVQAMRDGKYNFLITTSILERGVTFPEIDVFVLGADDQIFSSSALVQIAGRVGRSVSRPTGKVMFWVNSYSRCVREAQRQIMYMNGKGRKLLHD
ncbi:DEAD/DEAH box helicase [Limosilactobacillus fastidiosus]|uniref:DEAD/DEAH box helicase family protein n=1 Tax=Limosilactobacillus fastidiosus TaxID=2759855 RepID=A0A7W3TZE9_9LACO|nr:helicase-related protein [Limosilactobacillus fastidiosus]MBB1063231.1 DEAD/DEAH box helicase family protein [Limosilactobacillus fastidiosus]MBB1086128.1 DEAD/DEAH box helicase family protein [Limosilactobacillus fastidiosus]MCD7084462.1 DEAD/DEAH box helicase family protein [Limosilactobacillus fastidiosus]MCD7085043.1 DEAD/DEAH box helicase family protein [Limosilactobacillus fastidiosus]MCD7114555.1 DEAD/DEAH box helicase family protein [Limosilactobacillus fastidiosus]